MTENYHSGMNALWAGELAEALRILSDEPLDSPCFVLAIGNAGQAALRMDQYERAEKLIRTALATYEQEKKCPHPPSIVQFYRNLGESLVAQNRSNEAIPEFVKACAVAKLQGELTAEYLEELELQEAFALNSWGSSSLRIEKYVDAEIRFREARVIFKKYAQSNKDGIAETLTNHAVALEHIDKLHEAELALLEARDVVRETGDYDQLARIEIRLAQIGSTQMSLPRAFEIIEAHAAQAVAEGRYSIAYNRYCIIAELAEERGYADIGLLAIKATTKIENFLSTSEINPPKLRLVWAHLLNATNESFADILSVLVYGAEMWYKRLALPLRSEDFKYIASTLHNHFRFMARLLIDDTRYLEALVCFEAGRALGHALEVNSSLLQQVLVDNPFQGGSVISTSTITIIQGRFDPNEVWLVLAILPPSLIGFLIRKDRLDLIEVALSSDKTELARFESAMRDLPINIHAGKAERSVPASVIDFANKISNKLLGGEVTLVLPHSIMHLVPWRTLLYHTGTPLSQLGFVTGFGMVLYSAPSRQEKVGKKPVIALANGRSMSIDFADEAREFLKAMGLQKELVLNCSKSNVMSALSQQAIVLISCHGNSAIDSMKTKLFLHLDDVWEATEVWPERVNADLVILSACESGVYEMSWGDYPTGGAPDLIRRGARQIIGTRFPVSAEYAKEFMVGFARKLAGGSEARIAFAAALNEIMDLGYDKWLHGACFELIGGY